MTVIVAPTKPLTTAEWVAANWGKVNPGNTMNESNTPGAQSQEYLTRRIDENGGLGSKQYGADYWLNRMGQSDADYTRSLGPRPEGMSIAQFGMGPGVSQQPATPGSPEERQVLLDKMGGRFKTLDTVEY